MIPVDWMALGLGSAAGLILSALFFAGLAVGIQRALRARSPARSLALSALARIIVLLAGGWITVIWAGPWAFLGYACAFLVTRQIALMLARSPISKETSE